MYYVIQNTPLAQDGLDYIVQRNLYFITLGEYLEYQVDWEEEGVGKIWGAFR